MKKLNAIILPIAFSLLLFVADAGAQAILTENFKYPDGALVGASGSPWVTTSGTPGQLNVVNGELFLSDADSEDAAAPFSGAVTGGILTATFNFRADTDVATSGAGDYIGHFLQTGSTTAFGRFFVIASPGGANDDFFIGVSTTSTAPTAQFGGVFTAGVNLSITLSYNFATDIASLAIAGFGTINATDAVNVASIDRFQWREGGGTQGDAFVDNLAVVVPEPSTYILFGLGALIAVQRFRRKRL
jgi:hypothetical protein